ncbi:MAG: asparaginase [Ilumatobacteraceae bacterium]
MTTRSGVVESVHRGAVVALEADGSIAWAVGDPDVGIYARSALKPLQAVAMVAAGLALPDRLLAVVCASHDGRPEHLAAVREILAGAGLADDDLENTPTLPLDPEAIRDAIRHGVGPAAVLQNCSGKHAGMLATAVINGWTTAGYTAPGHPVQRLILESLESATGSVHHVGVDGCGAPAPVVPLVGLARAVRRLAVDGHPVHRAMTGHPELVGGPTRDVTRLMRLVPGLVAKDGAEGTYVAALPDGRAVALKVADGARRARAPVMVAALRALGVDLAADAVVEVVLGHGEPVGRVSSLVGRP